MLLASALTNLAIKVVKTEPLTFLKNICKLILKI